jgi:hypothetical protein
MVIKVRALDGVGVEAPRMSTATTRQVFGRTGIVTLPTAKRRLAQLVAGRSWIESVGALALAMLIPLQPINAQARDLYSEFNVSGSVTVSIFDPRGQPRCARLWWVKRLIGGVRQLGTVCGVRTLEIPSFLGISLASKLRGSADRGTVITVTAREGVAKTIDFGI